MKKFIAMMMSFVMPFSMISIIPAEAAGTYYMDVGETMWCS